ncbi:hypothetical protein THOM_0103 [Trachipleistophora hominis]|uniref:Uncharacterized protein n=1 Tax=Trachipleistophora hominis TaxID=72359 RepID=L7K0K8_TRAHO|nr:hypothetical protein THOM_0103 [Trachipleistophora hominis]
MLILHILTALTCTIDTHYEVPIKVVFEDIAFRKIAYDIIESADEIPKKRKRLEYARAEESVRNMVEGVENYVNMLLSDLKVSVSLEMVYENANSASEQICANPHRMRSVLKQLKINTNTIYVVGCTMPAYDESDREENSNDKLEGPERSIYINASNRPDSNKKMNVPTGTNKTSVKHKKTSFEINQAMMIQHLAMLNNIRAQDEKRWSISFEKQLTVNMSRCVMISGVYLDENLVYNLRKAAMEITGGGTVRANVDVEIRRGICQNVMECYDGVLI